MALLKVGVPFDVAFSIDTTTRQAMLIAHGINQGGSFDFDAWRWEKRE